MKEFLSETDAITTLSTQEMIRQNMCQMRILDKLVFKQDIDNELMINTIICSMLRSDGGTVGGPMSHIQVYVWEMGY